MEVHPVRFDDQGNGHLLTQDGEPFGHSAEAFAATGSVSGYRVACLSAEAQMSNHSWGYEPGDTDVQDMRLLHDRLGTPLMARINRCEAVRAPLVGQDGPSPSC
jgi:hypothetical protein